MSSANPARAERKNVGETIGGLTGGLLGAAMPVALGYHLGSHAIEGPLDAAFGSPEVDAQGRTHYDAGAVPATLGVAGGVAAAASPWVTGAILPAALSGAATGAAVGRDLGSAYHGIRTSLQTPEARLQDIYDASNPSERRAVEAFRAKTAVTASELAGTHSTGWTGNAAKAVRAVGGAAGTLLGVGGALLGGSLAGSAVHALGDSFVQPYDEAAAAGKQELADIAKPADALKTIHHDYMAKVTDPTTSESDRAYYQTKIPGVELAIHNATDPEAIRAVQENIDSAQRKADLIRSSAGVAAPLAGGYVGLRLLQAKSLIAPLSYATGKLVAEPVAGTLERLTPAPQAAFTAATRLPPAQAAQYVRELKARGAAPDVIAEAARGLQVATAAAASGAKTAVLAPATAAGGVLGAVGGGVAGSFLGDYLIPVESVATDPVRGWLNGAGALAGGLGGYAAGSQLGARLDKPKTDMLTTAMPEDNLAAPALAQKTAGWGKTLGVLAPAVGGGLAAGYYAGEGMEALSPYLGAPHLGGGAPTGFSNPGWNAETLQAVGNIGGGALGSNVGAHLGQSLFSLRKAKQLADPQNLPLIMAGLAPPVPSR